MKVISCELSEKLKEAGAKQESEDIWISRILEGKTVRFLTGVDGGRGGFNPTSAFDCSELLERLPQRLAREGRDYRLNLSHYSDAWYAQYRINHFDISYFAEDTPVEALGRLYLWCLKEGHIKEDGV